MLRLILLFAVVVATVVFVNWLLKEDPKRVAASLRRGALWVVAGLALLLVVTGRLPWLFGLVAAAVPVVGRLLSSLLRYAPLFNQAYGHYQNARARSTAGATGTGSSQVSSKYLRMTLSHDTGEMDGEILQGRFAGRRLSQLRIDDLLSLLEAYQADDGDSASLLQSYLDRYHNGWEQQGHRSQAGKSTAMSKDEAGQILGVSPGAPREEIIQAHRRLMQKLHPDRGGSDYLAAKVNQAKDLLLGE
ncbi:MAG: DnaJ domain-containing protein [Arenicellales bacterium]